MFRSSFVLFAWLLSGNAVICSKSDSDLFVNTTTGPVKGVHQTTFFDDKPYISFKKIPYAEPPIGQLRFKAPVQIDRWQNVLETTNEYSAPCHRQTSFTPFVAEQSEDCLYLNVFKPANIQKDAKLAVMFFIHGGGFTEGSSNDAFFGPDFLIEHDVVYVSTNYRLGTFGFLNLDEAEYSGNMGLKDQQLALEWTYNNIEHFGGDKDRITVFGQSAGGSSTQYQIISKKSRKYIKQGICMSGTSLSYFANADRINHRDRMFDFAKTLNAETKNVKELIEFLKTVPAEKIVEHLSRFYPFDALLETSWMPVIESEKAVKPFLTESVRDIYAKEKIDVPIVFGFTNGEYQTFALQDVADTSRWTKTAKDYFSLKLPVFGRNVTLDAPKYRQLAEEIFQFYFKNNPIDDTQLNQYMSLLSDLNFVWMIDETIKLHAKHAKGKTYRYRFSVDLNLNMIKKLTGFTRLSKSSHGDDVCYFLFCGFIQKFYDEVKQGKNTDENCAKTVAAIRGTTEFFTSFAKTGIPTFNKGTVLQPVLENQMNFLDITSDSLKAGIETNDDVNRLWNNVLDKAVKLSSN